MLITPLTSFKLEKDEEYKEHIFVIILLNKCLISVEKNNLHVYYLKIYMSSSSFKNIFLFHKCEWKNLCQH